jgi:hypothetical protein
MNSWGHTRFINGDANARGHDAEKQQADISSHVISVE